MKGPHRGLLAGILAAALSVPAAAQGAPEHPSFVINETSSTQETVVDIDYQKRSVTLKGDEGKVRTVTVGPEARNFTRVQKGDTLTVEVQRHIAVEVQPGPGDTMNIGSETQAAAPLGAKPSGVRVIEGKLKTRVEGIDHEARTIRFKDRHGVLKTYNVGPQATRFGDIRRGDMLVIEYSETTSLSVK